MKIKHVHFEKLFNHFDYDIEFNESVTIIHGSNGCGKTTMLRILDALFNKKVDILKTTEFKFLKILFSDDTSLKVERKSMHIDNNDDAIGIIYLEYDLFDGKNNNVYNSFEESEDYIATIKRFLRGLRPFPWLERVSDVEWYDRRVDRTMTTEEVVSQFGAMIYKRYGKDDFDDIPENVAAVLDEIDIRLISADRLTVQKRIERQYGEDNIKIERRVDIIAEELSMRIQRNIQEYAQISQAKDRTFPLRAIKQEYTMLSVDEIKTKVFELETKRKEFIDTGILEKEKDDININELVNAITESNRQNLSLYVTDTEEKLNALSSLSSSINLFRGLIDKSFNHKTIIFNKEYGFKFKTTYSDAEVLPRNLSSGEQHELVMFYDWIFNTTSKTLILIDEPELSLHIKWQLSYVDELLKIINNSGFSAVLATHSPQIINDKWDLTVSLSKQGE